MVAKQRHSRLSWDSVREGSWQPRTAGLRGLCAVSMVGEVQWRREAEGGWPATFLETSARLSSGSLGAEKSVKEEQARGWPEGSISSKALGRKVLGVSEDLHGLVRVGGRMEGRVTADGAGGATRSPMVRTWKSTARCNLGSVWCLGRELAVGGKGGDRGWGRRQAQPSRAEKRVVSNWKELSQRALSVSVVRNATTMNNRSHASGRF